MNVLVLGSGGREHALAWKIASSPECDNLFVAPGNPGTAQIAENLALSPMDFPAVAAAVESQHIDLVVVGPEDPLVEGIADFLRVQKFDHPVAVLGPDKLGAALEGSKAFAKEFMAEFNIPTARYAQFGADDYQEALEFLGTLEAPYVIKADGLAAGKGVLITSERKAAEQEIAAILIHGKFGQDGKKLVLEEFLSGIELSVFILTDGEQYQILPEAKDYKRIGEGDTGLNTGGMGAVSPVPFADAEFMQKVEERIVQPSIRGIAARGMDYRGFLFIGLMNVNGDPYVIEYNVRMGDPETQVVMPRIKSDLLPTLYAAATKNGKLPELELHMEHALAVILVSGGYPESYEKGYPIQGLGEMEDGLLFHAGTAAGTSGTIVTQGGRVLALVAMDSELSAARQKAYRAASRISYEKQYFRRDIGLDLGA
jgi:phosphoribosylamine--glycine ligase